MPELCQDLTPQPLEGYTSRSNFILGPLLKLVDPNKVVVLTLYLGDLGSLMTWSQSQEQDRKNETLSSPIGPQVPPGSTLEKILVPQIFFVNVLLRALSLLSIIEQFYFNRTLLLNFELDYS